jgi:hypothetical protein
LEGFGNKRGVACAWGTFAEYLELEDEACDLLDTKQNRVLVFLDFFQWLQTEGPIMESEDEIKPLAPATVKTYKSSVASLFRCIWKEDVAADPSRNHPSSPKYFDIWDAQLILDFYRNSKPPKEVKEGTRYIWQRAAVSVLFFGVLRIKELVTLDWRKGKKQEDGLMLQVVTKSDNDHFVPLFIPKLGGENSDICPVAALEALAQSALAVANPEDIGAIFTDYLRNRVLSQQTISVAIKEILVKPVHD